MAEPIAARTVAEIDWSGWTPVDRATLVFVIRDGQMLLIRKKRGLGAGKINAPGGRLEDSESPLQCALRELSEEVRLSARHGEECGELRFQFVDGYSIHVWVFRVGRCQGTARETDEATPIWTRLDRIPYDEMWPDDRLWVPLLLERRRFRGRFVFDGDQMLDHALEVDEPSGLE